MYAIVDFYDAVSAVSQGPDQALVDGLRKVASLASGIQVGQGRSEDDLDDSRFGLVYRTKTATVRRYALDTADNARLSMVCFDVFGRHVGPEETVKVAGANIINACERFGIDIPGSLSEFRDPGIATNVAPPPRPKTVEAAADEDHYLFVVGGRPRYPVKTPEQVKMASDYFDAHWRDKGLRPDLRVEMARKIAKRAEALGVTVSEKVKALSGQTFSPYLKAAIEARKEQASSGEHIAELDGLVARKDELGPHKFAQALYRIDARYGQAVYRRAIPDPWMSVFLDSPVESSKEASQNPGDPVVRAAWKLASQGELAGILGMEILAEFRKNPEATVTALDAGARAALLASGA